MNWSLLLENEEFVLRPRRLPPGLESAVVHCRPGGTLGSAVTLDQVHGTHVAWAEDAGSIAACDGARTATPGLLLTVRTADCLPVILATPDDGIALVHAGWRGLVAGILENAVSLFQHPDSVSVLFGPAIGPCCFEVGPEVAERFAPENRRDRAGSRPHADLHGEARDRLVGSGVAASAIGGPNLCTKCNQHLLYSYRGSGGGGGRLVTAVRYRPASGPQ